MNSRNFYTTEPHKTVSWTKTEKDTKLFKVNSNYFQFHDRIIWTAQNLQGIQGSKQHSRRPKYVQDVNLVEDLKRKKTSPQRVANDLKDVYKSDEINENMILPNPTDASLKR